MGATPPDELRDYARGEVLRADDVNAFVRSAKRQIHGTVGDGDYGAETVAPPKARVSLELDGIYDIPIGNRIDSSVNSPGGRIPPFGVVMTVRSVPRFPDSRSRGYYAAQWPSASTPYCPAFLVCGPRGVPAASSPQTVKNGWGSFLYGGGWVSYSDEDDAGADAVPEDNKECRGGVTSTGTPLPEVSWGPKPGSYLLWKGYNGFRVYGNTRTTWVDPVTDETIKIVYAHQVLKRPDGHYWANIGAGHTATTTEAVMLVSDHTASGGVKLNAIRDNRSGSAVGIQVKETGLYQYIMDGVYESSDTSGSGSMQFLVEVQAYRWTDTGGAGTYTAFGQVRNVPVHRILDNNNTLQYPLQYFSIHGHINMTRDETLAFKDKCVGGASALMQYAQLSVLKVDDYTRVPYAQ